MYAKALEILRQQNILFIKIFQSLANSNSLRFPPEFQEQLHTYTSNTSYTDADINYECLDYVESKYAIQIDRHVRNSGMISLVFKGEDALGYPVIVKLKRRNIRAQLVEGCATVKAWYTWLSYYFPNNAIVRILKPFMMNINDIIDQTDFTREIENTKQAKEEYEPLKFIHIPAVYNAREIDPEYILMEYIDGTHTIPPDADRELYMEQFGIFTCYAFLYNAIQHTDLHNGNFLFTKQGIGIIDFGMAIHLSDDSHDVVLNIATIIRDKQPLHEVDFIETFKDLFSPPLDRSRMKDAAKVEDICIEIARPLFDTIDADELNILNIVSRLSQYTGYDVVFNKDAYKMVLGVCMMAAKTVILGTDYPQEKFLEMQRQSLRKAYALIME
jgi:predicted unusual protein kinase regulating ubiquinone biosynthesis (AarF/ABC1/UbiB family)